MFCAFGESWRYCPESVLMEPETTAFLSQPQFESIVPFSVIEFEGRALDKEEATFPTYHIVWSSEAKADLWARNSFSWVCSSALP